MANLIDTVEIAGAAVYGVRQVSYTVDGVSGKDYGAALAAATFKESTAIEDTMNSYAVVVRQRTRDLRGPLIERSVAMERQPDGSGQLLFRVGVFRRFRQQQNRVGIRKRAAQRIRRVAERNKPCDAVFGSKLIGKDAAQLRRQPLRVAVLFTSQ